MIEFVELTVTRRLRVGQKLNISSSKGYLGIRDGVIEITGLVRPDEIPEEVEAWVDTFNPSDYELSGVEDEVKMYKEDLWVKYNYVRHKSMEDHSMPYRIFIDHTSVW